MISKKISKLINVFVRRIKRNTTDTEIKLRGVVNDLVNPVPIDWELSEADHRVISKYVELFLKDNEVDAMKMVVSSDIYPNLHKFIVALQGTGPWQETMSAYDYLEEHWPQLKPLLDAA